MVSIIIPYYNHWDLVHARLHELYKFVPNIDVEIILVNDCSTETADEGGVAWWQTHVKHHTIRYKKNAANLGFGGSMNVGAKIAKGDVLVFLSNDVEVKGNFIPEVLFATEINQGKVFIGNEIIRFDSGWNTFEIDGKKYTVPYANGWFLACTNTVWNELGGFDLRYGKFDYEDVDISTKALELGYNLVGIYSEYLRHFGGVTIQSLNVDRQAHTQGNKIIYMKKWLKKLPDILQHRSKE
jgi:GT2 family glycosyltransferase